MCEKKNIDYIAHFTWLMNEWGAVIVQASVWFLGLKKNSVLPPYSVGPLLGPFASILAAEISFYSRVQLAQI